MTTTRRDSLPLVLAAFALLSYGRVWLLHDGIWDDNTWLFSRYATGSLREFLETGFVELRRESQGAFLYSLLSLYRSTDWFYPLLHSINLTVQILAPILLYHLVRNLWPNNAALAMFIALSLIAFPLDHTLPYISAINYRLSLLLSLFSLFCTERALATGRLRPTPLVLALLSGGISSYVFLEAGIALEPARLLIVWHVLSRTPFPHLASLGPATISWSPFALLAIPLVYFKLRYKPYGLYEGMYPGDPLFFLDLGYVWDSLRQIYVFERMELKRAVTLDSAWATVLAACAVVLVFITIMKAERSPRSGELLLDAAARPILTSALGAAWSSSWASLVFGLVLFIPPASLFLYAHLPFAGEQHNTHAALLQLGSSFILGTGLWLLYRTGSHLQRPRLLALCLSLVLAGGVFINNKYLDLYFHSWQEQSRFLDLFLQRFPGLPDKAAFFFDVRDSAYFSDLRNSADFEFFLNLSYATSTAPEKFHRYHAYSMEQYRPYRVYPPEEFSKDLMRRRWPPPGQAVIINPTHWGTDVFHAADFIVVRYRDNELLVNREILRRYPDIEYKLWLDKDFPLLPAPAQYVFRKKLEGAESK